MKKIIHTIVVTVACFASVVFGDTPKNAIVRVIRFDDVATASTELPTSYTGCIISQDGYVATTQNAIPDTLNPINVKFMVYQPVYNENGNVDGVNAYTAFSTSAENGVAVLKIQQGGNNFPYATLAEKDITESADDISYLGYEQKPNFGSMSRESAETLQQAEKAVISQLREGICKDGDRVFFTHYMTPLTPKKVGAAPAVSLGGKSTLTVGSGDYKHISGLDGAPLITSNGRGSVVGLCFGTANMATPVSYIRNISENYHVNLGKEEAHYLGFLRENKLIIILVAGAVLCALVVSIVILLSARYKAPVPTPELELVGADGVRFTVTGKMVRHRAVIGRSKSALIHFENKKISRKHARFCVHQNKIALEDLNSTHGTYLNGTKLVPGRPAHIHRGDIILFAEYRVEVR